MKNKNTILKLKDIIIYNKVNIEAFLLGIFLIVLLEAYYMVTIPGTSIYVAIMDITLSTIVMLIVALFYFKQHAVTKKALRESESKFEALAENALEMIWEIDDEGRYTYVSPVVEEILGYSTNEIIGRFFYDFSHPDDIEELKKASEVFASKTSFRDFVSRKISKNGCSIRFSSSGVPIFDKSGTFQGYRCISQNITGNKSYEEKLEALHMHAIELESAETMEQVAKSTFDAIEKILGYDYLAFGIVEEDMLHFKYERGLGMVNTLPLRGKGITVRAVKNCETQLVNDVRKDQDYVSSRYQGEPETLSELDVPIKVDGEVVAVVNIESEKLNAFNDEDRSIVEILGQHVASAISIIHQREKYYQSLKELERSNRELDDYTYAVSHDLKAPLRTIHAFASLLQKDCSRELNEKGQDYVERIQNASKRMQSLIDDLLILSRIGRKYSEFNLVDLNKLIDEIRLDFEAQFKERGAKILSDMLPTIRAQKVWIRQLFTNLIDNGLKFNKSPTPTVWVAYEEHRGDYLFSVKDNGIGMAEKDQEKIFKLFQRLHTEEEYPGTGTGLAICKKIVESYKGRIWFEAKPDEGSIFYFTYPKKTNDISLSPEQISEMMQSIQQVREGASAES